MSRTPRWLDRPAAVAGRAGDAVDWFLQQASYFVYFAAAAVFLPLLLLASALEEDDDGNA